MVSNAVWAHTNHCTPLGFSYLPCLNATEVMMSISLGLCCLQSTALCTVSGASGQAGMESRLKPVSWVALDNLTNLSEPQFPGRIEKETEQ